MNTITTVLSQLSAENELLASLTAEDLAEFATAVQQVVEGKAMDAKVNMQLLIARLSKQYA